MNGDSSSIDMVCANVAECIREADNILFITGAGISADSGLPTYRGVGGLYEQGETEDGVPIEAAVSGLMLRIRPELTWKYLWQTEAACYKAQPNRAHEIIAFIQQQKPNTWVLTQNIDGLHRAAGTTNLIEIHGYAFDLYCMQCGSRYDFDDIFPNCEKPSILPPTCRKSHCSGVIRPNVVLFGEFLPKDAQMKLQAVLDRGLDLVISIGTSSSFPYIVAPIYTPGIPTVEINPTETVISKAVTYRIAMRASDAMEHIWNALNA